MFAHASDALPDAGGKEVLTRSLRRHETVRNNNADDVPVFLGAPLPH